MLGPGIKNKESEVGLSKFKRCSTLENNQHGCKKLVLRKKTPKDSKINCQEFDIRCEAETS